MHIIGHWTNNANNDSGNVSSVTTDISARPASVALAAMNLSKPYSIQKARTPSGAVGAARSSK
jgi:hypothetical protein